MVLHLLYANTINRGGSVEMEFQGGTYHGRGVEVVEDMLPLKDVKVSVMVKNPSQVKRVVLEPQGRQIPFSVAVGGIAFMVDEFSCHQMVSINMK